MERVTRGAGPGSAARSRDLESRVIALIEHLRPPSSPTTSSLSSLDEATTQRAYAAARLQLGRLQSEIADTEDDVESGSETNESTAVLWRRRQRRYDCLERELWSAVSARRRHFEWETEQQLIGASDATAISLVPSSPSTSSALSSTVEEARGIAGGLERTYDMMRRSISQVETTTQTINMDGHIIDDTFDQHRSFNSTTMSASRLLRWMQRQQRADRWKLRAALASFSLVCCFIFVRRMPGVGIFIGSTRKFACSMQRMAVSEISDVRERGLACGAVYGLDNLGAEQNRTEGGGVQTFLEADEQEGEEKKGAEAAVIVVARKNAVMANQPDSAAREVDKHQIANAEDGPPLPRKFVEVEIAVGDLLEHGKQAP